jgi:hypothetical protein
MPTKKNKTTKNRRSQSRKASKKGAMQVVKTIRGLQKSGVIETAGYSLELPFSRRLTSYGVSHENA